ncbi:MAG: lactonase family protein [Gemmataceae bacterium]|nr:lactonase family protein [Gemmataceae bacterium]
MPKVVGVVMGAVLPGLLGLTALAGGGSGETTKFWVFVGTYTGGKSKGIYRMELDAATGKLGHAALAAETPNPSFLAIHPSRKFLYAVGEAGGPQGGAVTAFALDAATGELKLLNRESSVGAGPCHIVVDQTGTNVLIANYGGGSAAVLPIQPDGRLKPASSVQQHRGRSVNKSRQEGPHAHSINLDPHNRFAFVADLGLDKVLVYRFDAKHGTLTPHDPPAVDVAPGAGPRHFAFHPNGKHAYVINELDLTITAFDYDAAKGVLTTRQTIRTLPTDVTNTKGMSTAEVVVHPSGKFLYGSNRGHNTIAIFRIGAAGELTAAGHQGHHIKTPRNFAIEPTGRYLLAANQGGDSIVVFAIDAESGALTPVGEPVAVPTPVCVRFVPR